MKTGVKAVCIIAALAAILAASRTAASGAALLSGDEMNGLRGGNAMQLYCVVYRCGGFEDCKQSPTGYCRPTDPNYPCNNHEQRWEYVLDCGLVTPNEFPCTPGPNTYCGYIAQCECKYHYFLKIWWCNKDKYDSSFYWPCLP